MPGGVTGRLPLPGLAALGAGLAGSALLPQGGAWVAALAVVILLGVPHGALDGEVARPHLRPRFGLAWFPVFALPYLALSAMVLLAWRVVPEATLAAFLAVSVWHFGSEDAGHASLPAVLARGGLPVALPVLLHPAATAEILGCVTRHPMPGLPSWLVAGSACWVVLTAAWIAARPRGRPVLQEMAALGVAFAVLPPLAAFAFYFVGFHAPRHMASLVGSPGLAGRLPSMGRAVLRSLPVTALTLVLGALLWRLYPGPPPERLLTLTLQGLAALTLPHLLLEAGVARGAMPPPLTSWG